MSNYWGQLATGMILFAFGLKMFLKREWYALLKDTYLDFGETHALWGVIWMSIAVIISCVAIVQIIRMRLEKRKKERKEG
jgi:tetrahydromethanopterin S-methyltransferase subunit E